VASESNGR